MRGQVTSVVGGRVTHFMNMYKCITIVSVLLCIWCKYGVLIMKSTKVEKI